MDVFNNRRDISQNGIKRRNDCDKMMDMMQKEYNVTKDAARAELLKIMSGEPGDIVKNILPTRNPSK
jgi:hypothetical protein